MDEQIKITLKAKSWIRKYVPIMVSIVVVFASVFILHFVFAASGSGTSTVSASPSTTLVNSTGNTLTFTYTAAETMDSGGISIAVPATWTTPQGTSGVAGYTTVSTTGIVGQVFDEADSATGWTHGTGASSACTGGESLDTTVFHSGTGSIKCINSNDGQGGLWYKNVSTQDWSGFTEMGFWIRSASTVTNSQFQFIYSSTSNLGTPITSGLSFGADLVANTWTYVHFTLTGTRTSVASYGFKINNSSNAIKNDTIWVDSMSIGATSSFVPTFSGNTILVSAISLSATQTITVAYGAGGGASGATAPSVPETSTFTTRSKIVDSGTLTALASSPSVSVLDTTVPSVSMSAPSNDALVQGSSVSLAATASDNVAVAGVTFKIDGTTIGSEDISSAYTGTLDSTGYADGSHSLTAVARDSSNNTTTSSTRTITIDNTLPTLSSVSLTSNNSGGATKAKVGNTITLSFISSETISTPTVNITSGGVSVNDSPSITNPSGNNWQATYVASSSDTNGAVAFSINSFHDTASNNGSTVTSGSGSVTFDKTSPTVSLSSEEPTITDNTPFVITAEFSETVSGFSLGDISVTNGVASNLSGSDDTYTFDVTPSGNGEVTIKADADSVQDGAGNSNVVGSNTLSIDFESVRPTVTITSNRTSPTKSSTINVTVTFSSPVRNVGGGELESSAISIDGAELSEFDRNSSGEYASEYTFTLTPDGDGVITVEVDDGEAENIIEGASHPNYASSTFSITYDSTAPSVDISDISSPVNTTSLEINIHTDEDGSVSFSPSKCESVIDTLSSGDNTATFSDLEEGSYDCVITVTDEAGNSTTEHAIFEVSFSGATVELSSSDSDTLNSAFTVTATFSANVSGFALEDIDVENGTASALSAVGGSSTIYSFTVTPTTDGLVSVSIPEDVAVDVATNGNSASDTLERTYDHTAPVVSSTVVTTSARGARFDWATNELASSQIYYGLSLNAYSRNTSETDTLVRTTTHSVSLTNTLVSCTRYKYKISSKDAVSNAGIYEGYFTTKGCAGNADVSISAGGSVTLSSEATVITVAVPISFSDASAEFQVKKLDMDTTTLVASVGSLGIPENITAVPSSTYDIHSLSDVETAVSEFAPSNPIGVTLSYSDEDIAGLDESTLWIYRYDEGEGWTPLSSCAVNATEKKVMCDTDGFSAFAIFGQSTTVEETTEEETSDEVVDTPNTGNHYGSYSGGSIPENVPTGSPSWPNGASNTYNAPNQVLPNNGSGQISQETMPESSQYLAYTPPNSVSRISGEPLQYGNVSEVGGGWAKLRVLSMILPVVLFVYFVFRYWIIAKRRKKEEAK